MSQPHSQGNVATSVWVALGANKHSPHGSPAQTIQAAVEEIAQYCTIAPQMSAFYRTPAFPEGAGPDYINAVVNFSTKIGAVCLIDLLYRIELNFGRERNGRWASRTLDLDLLSHGDSVLPSAEGYTYWRDLPLERQMVETPEQLILPHPRIQDRAFVLVPLAEISPDWRHPVSGLSAVALRDALPAAERALVVQLA
ncbi:MAG: 2-amino-4-hydroxy-6-hydroxymethyldihydropteridine diphosphokinase [Rhodobacteraceae bacterium]|nr:2-amino-4-hydroxy-6-hydroxymethyldihydropteridine diphosphokinase [Paracoccaceae bacterium]